jgi:hypothetical protein
VERKSKTYGPLGEYSVFRYSFFVLFNPSSITSIASLVMPVAILPHMRPLRRVKPILLDSVPTSRRRASAINSRETSRISSICLPSPSILAAHAYSLQQENSKLQTSFKNPGVTQDVQQSQHSPSILQYSNVTAKNLQNFKFSPSSSQGTTTTKNSDIHAQSPGYTETSFFRCCSSQG